jgi:hypothetical protein
VEFRRFSSLNPARVLVSSLCPRRVVIFRGLGREGRDPAGNNMSDLERLLRLGDSDGAIDYRKHLAMRPPRFDAPRDAASLLVQSDLSIFDAISSQVVDVDLGEVDGITDFKNSFANNVIQYEVIFDINTNASMETRKS